MAEFLFEQMPAIRDGTEDQPVLAFSVNDAMFSPVPSLDVMSAHWGINMLHERELSTVKITFHTGAEDQSLDDELVKLGSFPPGEPFTLVKFMGPGVFFTGLAWAVECAAPNCVTFDLQVVRASTGAVVMEVKNISASRGSTFNGKAMPTKEFIGTDEAFLLKLVFKTLPYLRPDGTQTWGTKCDPVPCMGIRVHALIEDSCLAVYNTGCGVSGPCCSSTPTFICDTVQATPSC